MLQNPHRSQPRAPRRLQDLGAGPIGAKKLAPHGPSSGISAKKLPQQATKRQFWGVLSVQGELFRAHAHIRPNRENFFAEVPVERLCWASFFAEMPLEARCWASFFAPTDPAPRSCRRRGARGWLRWGFCSIRSWLAVCRRRVVPLVTPFPPFGGGPAELSAVSARAPSRRTSPRRARRRSSTTTSSRRRRNMSAALDRLKQQNEPE